MQRGKSPSCGNNQQMFNKRRYEYSKVEERSVKCKTTAKVHMYLEFYELKMDIKTQALTKTSIWVQ